MQLYSFFLKYKGFDIVIFTRNYFSIDNQIFRNLAILK